MRPCDPEGRPWTEHLAGEIRRTATPAAQMTVCASMRSLASGVLHVTPSMIHSGNLTRVRGRTPNPIKGTSAASEKSSGNAGNTRGQPSSSRIRDSSGWIERKSWRSVSRAIRERSGQFHPGSPAPTITKVSQDRRRPASGSRSAASNAYRTRLPDLVASSTISDQVHRPPRRHVRNNDSARPWRPSANRRDVAAGHNQPRVRPHPDVPTASPNSTRALVLRAAAPAKATRSRPAKAIPWPPGKAAAGTGGNCAGPPA